jgi:hypothetical protein
LAKVKPGKPTELVEDRMPTIIDLNAEAAKLALLRAQTLQTPPEKRKGSMAR